MRNREADPDNGTYFTCNLNKSFIFCGSNKKEKDYFQFGLLSISDEQLILTLIDFSFPALSAVPATIAFLFQQIFLEPDIQQKIQREIDQFVGQGRAPTLNDRVK